MSHVSMGWRTCPLLGCPGVRFVGSSFWRPETEVPASAGFGRRSRTELARASCQAISWDEGPTLGRPGSGTYVARRYRITPQARADLPEFLQHQMDACLDVLVRSPDHVPGTSARSPCWQAQTQFTSFRLVPRFRMHALFHLMKLGLAHHPRYTQQEMIVVPPGIREPLTVSDERPKD